MQIELCQFTKSATPSFQKKRGKKELPQPRDFKLTRYMQRPPIIMPNYGAKKITLGVPKTSISRVLLYDNITQQQMLDVKLAHIDIEKQRAGYKMDLHKKSFANQAAKKRKRKLVTVETNKNLRLPQMQKTATSLSRLPYQNTTLSLRDVRLPTIKQKNKEILLQVKSKTGQKELYYSYDESGIFVDFVPLFSFYPNIKDDPRFVSLEESLILPEVEHDNNGGGFAVLSPSYIRHYPRIPTFLRADK